MKVLFVGEGEHEVGSPPHDEEQEGTSKARQRQPAQVYGAYGVYPAGGVLPVLTRKVVPSLEVEGWSLRLREVSRFPLGQRSGFAAKAKGAVLLARRYDCEALVIVVDRDGKKDEDRLTQLQSCEEQAHSQGIRVACGLAVESIEAWALGDRKALATVLDVDEPTVRKVYPKKPVEELLENSGKEEHRPKPLLQRLARLAGRDDGTDLRVEIAEQTDVAALEAACQEGFAPFAASLRKALGT